MDSKNPIFLYYLFCFLIGFYIANGTTVLFERELGFSFQQVFVLGGLYMLMFVLFEVPSGALADLLGRRNCVVLGCFVLTLGAVATGLSNNFWQVFASFFLWAMGFSFISGADEALLYDKLADQNEYAKVFGRARFFAIIGTALAGILGPVLYSQNFRWPYLASAIPFFLAAIAMLGFEESHQKRGFSLRAHVDQIKDGLQHAWENRYVRWSILIMSLTFAVWYNLLNSYQPVLQELGFGVRVFSVILPIMFAAEAVGSGLAGKFYGFFGEVKVFWISVLGLGTVLLVTGLWYVQFALAFIFAYQFFLGVLRPAVSAYANGHIESHHRATVISAQGMVSTVFAAGTLFLSGGLSDAIGLRYLVVILGGLVLVAGLGLLIYQPKQKNS
ncbi:MAG: MFS transporter [Candidatus Doudnabacteria bacterium]|nr:MFS transporter [Candidatus Doudnabacteria bacterium]